MPTITSFGATILSMVPASIGLAMSAGATPTMADPAAYIASAPEATHLFLALDDRMIVGGALLLLFVFLSAASVAMWRDLGRGQRPSKITLRSRRAHPPRRRA